ncbi:CpsD/CapB family tyrosine-protein kinase [Candidatus Omnitrophota bacterium]
MGRINKFLFKISSYLNEQKKNILGEIGSTTYIVKEERTAEGVDGRAIVHLDPKSHIAEQYRIMRTNIRAISPDNPLKSFTITSALRGEGKTVTSCNIALAFSQEQDIKVLLVDADLRKPGVHKFFGLSREQGLTDVLVNNVGLENMIEKPRIGRLYILTAGTSMPNPSEILNSQKIKSVISDLKKRFDYIFFDCAPIVPVTDAGVLGSQVDGTVLIVRAASTGALDIERAFSLLKEANAKPVGAVLTSVVTYIPYYLYRYRYIYVNKY